MLKDRKALIEQELLAVKRLVAKQYLDIALFAKGYKDVEYEAERIAYESTLHKFNTLSAELKIIDEMIARGNP